MDMVKTFIENLNGVTGIIALVWVTQQYRKILALEKEIENLKNQ